MIKKEPVIIKKEFTRDFPLILCQVWGNRYKELFGKKIKTFPQYIFLIKNGVVEAYRNSEPLNKELRDIFKKRITENRNFFKNFAGKHLQQIVELEKFYVKKDPNPKDLLVYTEILRDFWMLIYASLFIPNDMSYSKLERDYMLCIRHKINKVEYDAFHSIVAALKKIYPKLGQFSSFISLDELRKNSIPSKDKLKNRAKGTIVLIGDKLITENTLRGLEKKFNFILEEDQEFLNLRELRGESAYKGKVHGIVKIILRNNEISKIKKGEILVSGMTTPDFIQAMKNAAAFITNEGGITCHAAIVAREFKKPCIIGTKIATRVLHDGDLVEVDADKGIVKILKRAK